MASSTTVNILKQKIFSFQPISLITRQFSRTIIVYNDQQSTSPPISAQSSQEFKINEDVPGLSSEVVGSEEPVGPGASRNGEYKVPEYFNYNSLSYYEAEIEMLKYRCEQPSALSK